MTCNAQRPTPNGLRALAAFQLVMFSSVIAFGQSSKPKASSENVPNIEVSLTEIGSVYRVALPELIEGLEYQVAARLSNKTGKSWKEVRPETGCRCLRVESLNESAFPDGASVEMKLRIQPTSSHFGQELKVFSKSDASDSSTLGELLCKFMLSATTKPPVLCSHNTVVLDDKQEVKFTLSPADKRFTIKHHDIRYAATGFSCISKNESSGRVEISVSEYDNSGEKSEGYRRQIMLEVPIVFDGENEARWFRQEITVSKFGDVVVSPQVAVFRLSQDAYYCSMMIQDRLGNPTETSPTEIKSKYGFHLTDGKSQDTKHSIEIIDSRALAGNRNYLRLRMAGVDISQFADKGQLSLDVSVEGKSVKQIPTSFLE